MKWRFIANHLLGQARLVSAGDAGSDHIWGIGGQSQDGDDYRGYRRQPVAKKEVLGAPITFDSGL